MVGPTLPPKDPPKDMAAKYVLWICENVNGTGLAGCGFYTEKMIAAFPELKRVRGFVRFSDSSKTSHTAGSAHWWCETADGTIVDPTASQFERRGGIKSYVSLDESKEQPTGYCARGSICGTPTWRGASYCSDECREIHEAEIQRDTDEMNAR